MLKIKNKPEPKLIRPSAMFRGMVGVIVKWRGMTSYIGTVVVKTAPDALSCLDPDKQARDGGWTGLDSLDNDFLVEVLPTGTVIEITLE